MIRLESVSNPELPTAFALETEEEAAPEITPSGAGEPGEESRSFKHLVAKGKEEEFDPMRPFSIVGADNRVRIIDPDLYPWRMICALRMRGRTGSTAIGTGWLVGPRTLLTAGHCVRSESLFGGWATSIEVAPGRNGAELPFGSCIGTRFSSTDRWVKSADPDFDIGCIHLDEPIGKRLGWFAVGALPAARLAGYAVNVSGYPADRGRGTQQYHHRNRVLRVSARRVFYDVDTMTGQSGAPVWIHEGRDAPPLAVAVHAYGVGGSPGGLEANSAPRILPEVLKLIRAWVDEDGGWPRT